MQTTALSGQDGASQPYITLQPVSVDGGDISNNGLVQDGSVNLQTAVMTGGGGGMSADGKSLVSEGGQQVQCILLCFVTYNHEILIICCRHEKHLSQNNLLSCLILFP